MEKAEAIKIIKSATVYTPEEMEALETLIPELREGEDERIRKEIISIVKAYRENCIDEGTHRFDDCLSWLEKQKEQKPAEWSEEDEKMRNLLIYDVEYHKKEGLISAKQNKATKTFYDELERWYNEKIAWLKSLPLNLKKKNEDVVKLCSNEWSEEDNIQLNTAIQIVSSSGLCVTANWLKSLLPQPKQEWNKEDERNRDRAIFYTRFYQRNEGTTKGSEECIDWLKSLRPSWKPSDEQMEALRLSFEDAFNDAGDCNRYRRLKSLYEQLKQL